jgi:hypothetical protein
MSAIVADSQKSWKTRQERPAAFEVILLKRTYVLPWIQFLYAEGGYDEVHIAFATHDVVVRGAGLQSLLSDVAAQRIAQLREAMRHDQFDNGDAPHIRVVSVSEIEERH